MFRMFVGALVYYNDFLKEHIHRNSMARTSIFLIETIPLANFVTTTYPWNKTSATPEMTGISANVHLMAKIEDMNFKISILNLCWKQVSRQHWPASLMPEKQGVL